MLIVARKIPFIYHKTPHQSINSGTSHHLFEYIRSNLYGKPRYQTSFKSYQYWIAQLTSSLLNPINAGVTAPRGLQNPINTGLKKRLRTFKTLSILGRFGKEFPSKPYQYWGNHGIKLPSKPYQYWAALVLLAFKTLSIRDGSWSVGPSKPYQYWGKRMYFALQNPINTGNLLYLDPSKPYQYWVAEFSLVLQNPINTG